eukprot:1463936-Karenia_brevis.AAC.1
MASCKVQPWQQDPATLKAIGGCALLMVLIDMGMRCQITYAVMCALASATCLIRAVELAFLW